MNTNSIGRRKIILAAAGAGLSTLLCKRVSGEPTPNATPDATLLASQAGNLHSKLLQQTSKWLNGESISTEKGLQNLAHGLVHLQRIGDEYASQLEALVISIFHSENLDDLRAKIETLYKDIQRIESIENDAESTAANIVLAIVGIARDSVAFVADLAAKPPFRKAVEIVAADVGGAFTGAGAVPVLLVVIPIPQLAAAIRIICLIAGAGAASATVAFPIQKG